jgi:hypothetical protein
MTVYAKMRTGTIIFDAINDPVLNNTLFFNITTNKLSVNDGITSVVSTSATQNFIVKTMQAFDAVRAGRPVSKRADGKIMEADTDVIGASQPIGISLVPLGMNEIGNILLFGPNATGVLNGLGFIPGDEIFIGETTGGYVKDITTFSGNDDSIIRIGIADCAAGAASTMATDLILMSTIIARP